MKTISVPDSNVSDFAEELKALLLKHNVAEFMAEFSLLIEEHSTSLVRGYKYLHPVQNNNFEKSELTMLFKKVI